MDSHHHYHIFMSSLQQPQASLHYEDIPSHLISSDTNAMTNQAFGDGMMGMGDQEHLCHAIEADHPNPLPPLPDDDLFVGGDDSAKTSLLMLSTCHYVYDYNKVGQHALLNPPYNALLTTASDQDVPGSANNMFLPEYDHVSGIHPWGNHRHHIRPHAPWDALTLQDVMREENHIMLMSRQDENEQASSKGLIKTHRASFDMTVPLLHPPLSAAKASQAQSPESPSMMPQIPQVRSPIATSCSFDTRRFKPSAVTKKAMVAT